MINIVFVNHFSRINSGIYSSNSGFILSFFGGIGWFYILIYEKRIELSYSGKEVEYF